MEITRESEKIQDRQQTTGSRRQAVISGKYSGGVFYTMPDGTVCHYLYASRYADENFRIGDSVIIAIREFNYAKQQMFGRIIGKWKRFEKFHRMIQKPPHRCFS